MTMTNDLESRRDMNNRVVVVYRTRPPRRRPKVFVQQRLWEPAEADLLWALREQGVSMARCAVQLGRSRNSIAGMIQRLRSTGCPCR